MDFDIYFIIILNIHNVFYHAYRSSIYIAYSFLISGCNIICYYASAGNNTNGHVT